MCLWLFRGGLLLRWLFGRTFVLKIFKKSYNKISLVVCLIHFHNSLTLSIVPSLDCSYHSEYSPSGPKLISIP